MGCPGGMSTIQYTHSVYVRMLFGQFFFKFSQKKIEMAKKIVVPCLDLIMNAFFPGNIQ